MRLNISIIKIYFLLSIFISIYIMLRKWRAKHTMNVIQLWRLAMLYHSNDVHRRFCKRFSLCSQAKKCQIK